MYQYPHHIRDFNNATRHLTRIERSIYRELMDLYYDTEQPLTLDFKALCRKVLAHSEEDTTAVQQVLNEFFTETATGWYHSYCEKVIQDYRENISAKSAAGKASAAARERDKLAKLNGCSTDVTTSVQHPLESVDSSVQPTVNRKPETDNQEPVLKPSAKNRGSEYTPEFEEAWGTYPSRPGASKKDSFKNWRARISAGVAPADLIAGVVRYAAYVEAMRVEPNFIKQPATFFGPGEHYLADWTPAMPRASPAATSSIDKHREIAEALTGRNHGNQQPFIDIN